MTAYERLIKPENLNYAWIKAKALFRQADGYIDMGELAAFELNLEQELEAIRIQFRQGRYRLSRLRPLPRPKKKSGEDPINRQYYHISVADQVAWIAMVNALGPELDQKMPAWSYGNRLYRPAWYETGEDSRSTLEIGPYRHASGHLYRKFQHSWPLFRRHLTLTARMMAARRPLHFEEMDEVERLAAASAEADHLLYFDPDFWRSSTGKGNELYYTSIDLKQFYPALSMEAVLAGLGETGVTKEPEIAALLDDMLRFRIDMSGMPASALCNVEPSFLKSRIKGLPTGLFVAGFLANAAMLPVDRKVQAKLMEMRAIAHFRFVDDHSFIAFDFETLCSWISAYEVLLVECGIGATINADKYDPPSMGEWMDLRARLTEARNIVSSRTNDKANKLRDAAERDTRIDGKNPTRLLTKTLAQVSAIARADIHILDDEDLEERLKMLEWLLLADIPEREIRPDTRATFAAGQIAALAPILIQEGDGLVESARALARLRLSKPNPVRSTEAERARFDEDLAAYELRLQECEKQHSAGELALLTRCFASLLQALREHPGKARLFYRIHQYCRVTGFAGLKKISDWLSELREANCHAWADYYAGLSLQIMAVGMLRSARQIRHDEMLRSDRKAAYDYLAAIVALPVSAFEIAHDRETWFHAIARTEFAVAALQVSTVLTANDGAAALGAAFKLLATARLPLSPDAPSTAWRSATGQSFGVWAHRAEDILSTDNVPSEAWALTSALKCDDPLDLIAARRYPEALSGRAWQQLLSAASPLPETDSGWLRDAIGSDEVRRRAAYESNRVAFSRAARSHEAPPQNAITIEEWTASVHLCNPFDPRRSEWTALEITRQLLEQAVSFGGEEAMLDRLHPNNVLLPRDWVSAFPCTREYTQMSWESWRQHLRDSEKVRLREPSTSLIDYRYSIESRAGILLPPSERRLFALGRFLIGLLRNDHSSPRIWNLRGNELIYSLPYARWFEGLAISSPTALLIEACLGTRPAESRLIARAPRLFGWRDGVDPNDIEFDPPLVVGPADLLEPICKAQAVLQQYQLAVAMNQPRQLIPYRLRDFATATQTTAFDGGIDGE